MTVRPQFLYGERKAVVLKMLKDAGSAGLRAADLAAARLSA